MDSGLSIGMTILILTIIVKLVIMPLTYKNYMSTAKTKVLKPEITKINSKYEGKTDRNAVMKKQQETMSLYKQTGVSPMAGCIPMIIQAPILFAVFKYFPASLELRHKGFFWADDLSSYDSILDFGFSIPIYGDHISLFAILMAFLHMCSPLQLQFSKATIFNDFLNLTHMIKRNNTISFRIFDSISKNYSFIFFLNKFNPF